MNHTQEPARGQQPVDPPPPRSFTTELLRRAREGNQDAFGELLEHLRPGLERACRRAGHIDPAHATQDVWATAVRRAIDGFPEFEGQTPGEMRSWLTKIQSRAIVDLFRRVRARRRGPAASAGSSMVAASPSPACVTSEVAKREAAERVARAMGRLDENDRAVLQLYRIEELPLAEVAKRLGLPYTTVQKQVQRALERLEESMRR